MKYFIGGIISCLLGLMNSNAQSSNIEMARETIYEGYISGDVKKWEKGLEMLNKCEQQLNSVELKYEIALAQYGLIGFYMAEDKKNELESRLDETISLVKRILEAEPKHAQAHALLGGLYGLKIGMKPARGIYLGPKSSKHIEIATTQNPEHPAGWVEKGNAKYHTPFLLGGNMSEAIKCFTKAIQLFNANPVFKKYNWLYLHALAWLGQAYEKESNYYEAQVIYQKILSHEPNFAWVKDELLPALQKRMN